MSKEKLLEALFENYYATTSMTAEFEDAKLALCEDSKMGDMLCEAIKAETEMAYKAAFNAVLTLIGGAK